MELLISTWWDWDAGSVGISPPPHIWGHTGTAAAAQVWTLLSVKMLIYEWSNIQPPRQGIHEVLLLVNAGENQDRLRSGSVHARYPVLAVGRINQLFHFTRSG